MTTEESSLIPDFESSTLYPDLESIHNHAFLTNDTVQNFAWKDVSVTVTSRDLSHKKRILSNTCGYVNQGMTEPAVFCAVGS